MISPKGSIGLFRLWQLQEIIEGMERYGRVVRKGGNKRDWYSMEGRSQKVINDNP